MSDLPAGTKFKRGGRRPKGQVTHGTAGRYAGGCRCGKCREAKALYQAANLRQQAHRRARSMAATWLHQNMPDVYDSLVAQAMSELEAERDL